MRAVLRFPAGIAFGLVVSLSSCGGGGGAAAGGGSSPLPPSPTPDFTLSVTPATLTITAGGLSNNVTLSVSGSNGFTGTVNISPSMPAGFGCGSITCSGQVSAGTSLTMQILSASTVAAGNYTIAFNGTSGTLSHQASLSATVATAPVSLPNHSAEVFTDDFLSPGWSVAYDKVHDHIFASNQQLCEVEVISPETLQVIRTIYVPSPTGMDLSLDGATLYVGSNTQNLFEINTALLQLQARIPFSGDPELDLLVPTQVVALADGTIGIFGTCGTISGCTSASGFFILNPATGATTSPLLALDPSAVYTGTLIPSADRTRLFMANQTGSGGNYFEYSTATQALTSINIPGGAGGMLVARPDGNGYALLSNTNGDAPGSEQLLFLNSTFQVVGSWTNTNSGASTGNPIYSADSGRFYMVNQLGGPFADVFDANSYQHLGLIPTQGASNFFAIDGQNRLISPNDTVLALVDGSATPRTLPANPEILGFPNSLLIPDTPANGYTTTLNGAFFSAAPQIAFSGTLATNVQVSTSNVISLTAPKVQNLAQAELTAVFPDGTALVAPDAYSYQPTILYTDQDGSAEIGGSTLKIYGFGLDFSTDELGVKIGGNAASNVSSQFIAISPYFAPVYFISATAPPGTESNAEIEVSTPIGSATLPGGFAYVKRTDFALPSTAAPFQMILDKSRNRLLWTDTSTNALVVYSLTSGQIEQTISIGNTPAGLSLTPDGSDLLVLDSGDFKIDVYDAQSLALIQRATTPGPSGSLIPVWVSAVANGKAFLIFTINGYANLPVYEYDIASNTFTERSDSSTDQSSFSAASADGSTAFVGPTIWNASSDKFVTAFLSEDYPRALSSDGYAITEYRALYGRGGTLNGVAGIRWALESNLDFNSVSGQKLNSTGSLSYLPETDRIRIFDVRHGQLVQTIMVPDGLNENAVDGMAIDPDGQTIYVLTQTGVTTLQFAADPLSIGEVQASGNQLTILGSGFNAEASVTVDGNAAAVNFKNSQEIIASVTSLSSGPHQIVVTLPSGTAYSLDNALDTSAGTVPPAIAARTGGTSARPPAPTVFGTFSRVSLWQRLHRR